MYANSQSGLAWVWRGVGKEVKWRRSSGLVECDSIWGMLQLRRKRRNNHGPRRPHEAGKEGFMDSPRHYQYQEHWRSVNREGGWLLEHLSLLLLVEESRGAVERGREQISREGGDVAPCQYWRSKLKSSFGPFCLRYIVSRRGWPTRLPSWPISLHFFVFFAIPCSWLGLGLAVRALARLKLW